MKKIIDDAAPEQALYITRPGDLRHFSGRFSRIYFGNEFCQRLIPSAAELKRVIDFTNKNNLEFTFVTPFVTNDGLDALRPLLRLISEEKPESEVVFNDWGILRIINSEFRGLLPVMGRLLNKMKRGPRLMNLLDVLPEAAIEYYQCSSITTPLYSGFLTGNRVKRAELDNLLQGIDLKPVNSDINFSLYIPYAYITVSRFCLAASCDVQGEEDEIGIFSCRRECRKYSFELMNQVMGVPLIRKGNTIFFKNEKIPDNMREQNIDRFVIQPEIPI